MPTAAPSSNFVPLDVFNAYKKHTPHHLQVIDAFLVFVLATGIVQLLYVFAVGTFPFNSFLSGFLSCVGVFVLTVSLRMQLSKKNLQDPRCRWQQLSKKRAVADWLFCNVILLIAVLNFLG